MTDTRLSTGIDGLDEILCGGLLPRRTYLVRGMPGAGKTLVALEFLRDGVEAGDDVLFLTLEESEDNIRQNATSVGLDTAEVPIVDLSPSSEFFADDHMYDIFSPAETEGQSLVTSISEHVASHDPDRLVLDPVSQLRYIAPDEYQFRKQILSFIRFLREADATVLMTSPASDEDADADLQFLSDGVIDLIRTDDGRQVSVPKLRGSASKSGQHTLEISDSGLTIYPVLVPGDHAAPFTADRLSAGVDEIDDLLHGGLDRGTVTIISGPTGVGKTSLGTQFMAAAAGRNERSAIYLFEEIRGTFLQRSEAIDIPIRDMLDRDNLSVEVVEPLQHSPEKFAQKVRRDVEEAGSDIVMIDGIDGYRVSIRGESVDLTRKLHSVCRYLKNIGVTVILIDETGSVAGEFNVTSANISYLADSIVFLRYLELHGELRKAIGVLKKRTGDFERTLREFEITGDGLQIGEPLSGLRGILRGEPDWVDRPVDEEVDSG